MKSGKSKNGEQNSKELSRLQKEFEELDHANHRKMQVIEKIDIESLRFIVEFKKLNNYTEKLSMWKNYFWAKGLYSMDSNNAFFGLINILPEKDEERTLLNKERLALIIQYFERMRGKKTLNFKNATFEGLKENYLKNIKSVKIKHRYIENEIIKIRKEIADNEYLRNRHIYFHPNQLVKDNLFDHPFQLSFNHGLEPDFGERIFSRSELVEIITGISAGKYLKFLQDELLRPNLEQESQITEKLWYEEIGSLKFLRELLLSTKWIAEIEEEEFVNNFINKPFYKSINWLVEENTFMRLFDKLKFAINPTYLKVWEKYKRPSPTELSKHFVFKGIKKTSKQLTQIRSQNNPNNQKPKYLKREEAIEIIVNKIKKEF